jgi:glycine/D-amino acid oxidase-like deaminating enzyme
VHDAVVEEGLDALYEMGLMAIRSLRGRIEKYDIDCDFTWGYCTVAYNQRHLKKLKGLAEFLQAKNYPAKIELLEGAALHNVVKSDRYVGGLLDMGSGHLHPLNLLLGEAAAAHKLGVKIYENSRVSKIEYGRTVKVHTNGGTIRAGRLVIACNAYLDKLQPAMANKFLITNAFSIATEPLTEEQVAAVLPSNAAVCDNRPVIDYYRLSADKRLLFGGATHFVEYLPSDLAGHLRKNMLKVFPHLKDVRIDHAWSGQMAVGANMFPQVGRLLDHMNVYYVEAYAGFGVGPSHLTSKMIAHDILSRSEAFDLLSRIPHIDIWGGQALNRFWLTAGKTWHLIEGTYK